MTTTMTKAGAVLLLVLVIVLLFAQLWRTLPPARLSRPLPRLSPHALDKHKQDAIVAKQYVEQHGRFCHFQCDDGRERFIRRMGISYQ